MKSRYKSTFNSRDTFYGIRVYGIFVRVQESVLKFYFNLISYIYIIFISNIYKEIIINFSYHFSFLPISLTNISLFESSRLENVTEQFFPLHGIRSFDSGKWNRQLSGQVQVCPAFIFSRWSHVSLLEQVERAWMEKKAFQRSEASFRS